MVCVDGSDLVTWCVVMGDIVYGDGSDLVRVENGRVLQ